MSSPAPFPKKPNQTLADQILNIAIYLQPSSFFTVIEASEDFGISLEKITKSYIYACRTN